MPKIGMRGLFFNRTWSFIMYSKFIFSSWRKATPVFRNCLLLFVPSAAVVQWSIASVCARHAGDLGLIPVRVRRKSLSKQVVSAPMQYTRQKVWVSRVLGDDHFTVGVAPQNTLTAQWPRVSIICQILHPFSSMTNKKSHSKIFRSFGTLPLPVSYLSNFWPKIKQMQDALIP